MAGWLQALEEYDANPSGWAEPGPTRATGGRDVGVVWTWSKGSLAPVTGFHPAVCSLACALTCLLACLLTQPPPAAWRAAIVACIPAFMDESGQSMGGGAPMQRGASMATTQHVDPAALAGVCAC